jgi:hypothetical protein
VVEVHPCISPTPGIKMAATETLLFAIIYIHAVNRFFWLVGIKKSEYKPLNGVK